MRKLESSAAAVRFEGALLTPTTHAASDLDASSGARPSRRMVAVAACLAALFFLSLTLGLMVGRGSLTDTELSSTFLTMRAQRVAVAFLAGAALAVAGTIVQGLFRNPLASPSILGTTSGATLGGQAALIAVVLLFAGKPPAWLAPEMLLPFGCIAGAVVSLGILLLTTSLRSSPITLVLTGFVLSSLFSSVGSLLETVALESWELSRALLVFAKGSVSGAGMRQVLLAVVLVFGASLPACLWSRSLDLLLCGEEEALSLGVDVAKVRLWSVIWASLLTAGAVAVGGSVGFVGLIVPHALRPLVGESHRRLIPTSFIAGGSYLVLCDVLCRALPFSGEVPLGVVTGLIGAPVFLWMLARLEREGAHG